MVGGDFEPGHHSDLAYFPLHYAHRVALGYLCDESQPLILIKKKGINVE